MEPSILGQGFSYTGDFSRTKYVWIFPSYQVWVIKQCARTRARAHAHTNAWITECHAQSQIMIQTDNVIVKNKYNAWLRELGTILLVGTTLLLYYVHEHKII